MGDLPKATIYTANGRDKLFLDETEFPWELVKYADWNDYADGTYRLDISIQVRDVELQRID